MVPYDARRSCRIDLDEEIEDALRLAAPDGQHAVRRNGLHRLAEVVVHLEFFLGILPIQRLPADEDAFIMQQPPQTLAHFGMVCNALSDDVPRAFERLRDGRDLRIEKPGSHFKQRLRALLLRPYRICERLQATLPRNRRLGAALGPVRQVQVLQLTLVERRLNAGAQVVRQLALVFNRGKNGRTARQQVTKVRELVLNLANLYLVQRARRFLAVTRDERHGAAFIEQGKRSLKRGERYTHKLGKMQQSRVRKSGRLSHVLLHPSLRPGGKPAVPDQGATARWRPPRKEISRGAGRTAPWFASHS